MEPFAPEVEPVFVPPVPLAPLDSAEPAITVAAEPPDLLDLLGYVVAGLLVLALIHGWMFVLLQMEDYVLLSGTVGLLLALITVMYVTRNVDWYRVGAPSAATAVRPAD